MIETTQHSHQFKQLKFKTQHPTNFPAPARRHLSPDQLDEERTQSAPGSNCHPPPVHHRQAATAPAIPSRLCVPPLRPAPARTAAVAPKMPQRPALGLGRLAHGLTSGGKPMARHGCLTQTEQEKSFHGGIGHAMNERAIAGLAVPFAALDQFTQQPAQARIERGVRCGARNEGDGQGVHLKLFPVSGMYRNIHKLILYQAPDPSSRWRATGRSQPADKVP